MYRVLIADDEPIERVVISKFIQKNYGDQLEIVQAVNGREAITLFEEKNCDIALLDIEMPGINGLDAAETIRKKNRDCSIIFLTAFDEFTYAKRAISVKALDYLLKPGSDEELMAVLDEAIRLADEKKKHASGAERGQEEDMEETADSGAVRSNASRKLILDYIRGHYTQDISLQDAARAMNYSDAYFCKLFKQCFDKNFIAFLSEFRVDKAKQLLCDMTINVKEISERVGYRDSNYFAKVFKRITGVTPSEYRVMKPEER